MNCELCNSKGTVTVLEDELRRNWPCPKCRIRKFYVEYPFSDYDLLEWKDNAIPLEDLLRKRLKDRIARELAEAITDIQHRITGTHHVLYGELSVVTPL
jgi:hypothetical protein